MAIQDWIGTWLQIKTLVRKKKKKKNYHLIKETEEGKAAVTAYLTSDEAHRQLDWDGMYLANKLRYETIQNVDGIMKYCFRQVICLYCGRTAI